MFIAIILTTLTSRMNPPIPLDVDNGISGVELWFGNGASLEVGLLCHLDSCTAMNIINLQAHQWLMTAHPYLVAEYVQFDNITPF